jgi:hypothetical protein
MVAVSNRANTATAASRVGAPRTKMINEARSSFANRGAASRAHSSGNALRPTKVRPTTKGVQPDVPVHVRRKGPLANPSDRTLE